MAMNLLHRIYCRSDCWAGQVRDQLIPWVLDGPDPVELGDDVLEIGPGYGDRVCIIHGGRHQHRAVGGEI